MAQLPKFKWPTAQEIEAMRPEELKAIDVRGEMMKQAAMHSLAKGVPVDLKCGSEMICTFWPDGHVDTY